MGFWGRLKMLFGASSDQRTGEDFAVSRWGSSPPRRGAAQLIMAYKTMPWLQTLVDSSADGVADLQWKVYRPTSPVGQKMIDQTLKLGTREQRKERLKSMLESGEATEVPAHPMLQLIADPNDHLTGRQVNKLIQTHLDLVGESFLALDFDGKLPIGYWPLPPHAVTRLPDYSLPPDEQFFMVTFGRVSGRIPAANMLRLWHPDPDDPMGRGVGKGFTLGDELDTDEYAARFAKNFFYNNAIPAAVMSIEGMPQGENANVKQFKESLRREYQGADNAGKVLITGGKVTVARLDTDFSKMDLNAMRKGLRDYVRMNWRVPPEIVGDLTNSNKATAWAATDSFARQVIGPRAEFLRSEYQKRLMPRFGRLGDCIDYESPAPADQDFNLRAMGAFRECYRGNEVRALTGHKPDPKLNDFLAPAPGQKEAGPVMPDAPQGSEADTIEEQSQPSSKKPSKKSDPPWVEQPIV